MQFVASGKWFAQVYADKFGGNPMVREVGYIQRLMARTKIWCRRFIIN